MIIVKMLIFNSISLLFYFILFYVFILFACLLAYCKGYVAGLPWNQWCTLHGLHHY